MMLTMVCLVAILLGSPAVADLTQEEPSAWGGSVGAVRVTVEVESEQLPDRVRFTYTVRNLSESVEGRWPAIGSLVIGASEDSTRSEITTQPLAVESPPGWEGRVLVDDRTRPRTWRLQWSCSQESWEHRLKFQIKAGSALSGFRVSAVPGESRYLTATYTAAVDAEHGVNIRGALGLTGRPIVKKPRRSK